MQLPAASPNAVAADARTLRERRTEERAQAKLEKAQAALETLKQFRKDGAGDAAAQRKAAAKQRIDQLKARLRMLQMSSPVDPKALAQLARELKAAIKDYGGTGAGVGVATASPPAASGDAAEAQAGVAPQGAEAVAGKAPQADPPTAPDEPVAADGERAGEAGEPAPRSEADPYRRMAEAAQERMAEQSREAAERQEDQKFLDEVRRLAVAIKAAAKRATAEAKDDPAAEARGQEANEAADAALKEAESAAQALGGAGISITV